MSNNLKKILHFPNYDNNNLSFMGIFYGNVPIDRVYKTKILGITFDPDLRFSTCIEKLCSKINKRISFMSRLRHYVSLNAIYKSIVFPHFHYGILLYGFTYVTHL